MSLWFISQKPLARFGTACYSYILSQQRHQGFPRSHAKNPLSVSKQVRNKRKAGLLRKGEIVGMLPVGWSCFKVVVKNDFKII